ncbi:MAG: transposase, partial [Nitrosopumilaceae archaeon]
MAKFKPYDYNQMVMLPVCLSEQIIPNTLEHTIHTLIENRIDMSVFDSRYNNDDTGCYAYNPKVLLKVVLLGYARSLLSSRKLERACRENILFMALSCGQAPDHSTIASFVSSMEQEILSVFQNILLVCDEQGLLGGTCFAIDGVKLPSNASKMMSGTFDELREKKT